MQVFDLLLGVIFGMVTYALMIYFHMPEYIAAFLGIAVFFLVSFRRLGV